MFSDKFMHKSVNHHYHQHTVNGRTADCSSLKTSLIPKRKSAPNTLSHCDVKQKQSGSCLLGQQSLPCSGSLLSRQKLVLSHSVSVKPCSHQRQQSIPSKGSPKPPLLERTHTVHSVPVVITHTRAARNFTQPNSAPSKEERRLPIVRNTQTRHRTTSHSFEHGKRRGHRVRGRSVDVHIGVSSKEAKFSSGSHEFALPYSVSACSSREHSSLDSKQPRVCKMKSCEAYYGFGRVESRFSDLESEGFGDELSSSVEDEGLLVFEEELTDLDDSSSSGDEDDILKSGGWADQDPVTCIQHHRQTHSETNAGYPHSETNAGYPHSETNAGYPHSETNAGYPHSETNAGYPHSETNAGYPHSETNAGYPHSETNAGSLGKVFHHEMTLIAEIERRRERDFGCVRSTVQPLVSNCKHKSLCSVAKEDSSEESSRDTLKTLADDLEPLRLVTAPLQTQGHSSLCASGVMSAPLTPRGADQPSPPLCTSLFPKVFPPTIHFPLPDENYVPLPKSKRAFLKWKMSSITPNIVKHTVARAGFSKWSRGSVWIGYWGKHMKEQSFKTVKEYQKVNHFPGTFQIGRKDRLWRNLSRMQIRVGRRECDFIPQTFVLPHDLHKLKKEWDEGPLKQKWILKPPAAARGIGVRLIHKWSQIPKKRPIVVQRYISDPFLINGSKFDLRVYVYVSSYDPLKVYVFREGLARFATTKYSTAMKHLSNKFMHLTNYSINKHNVDFTPNADEKVCQGHKWGLLALWHYMETQLGLNTTEIWQSIKDVVIKTIVCSEPYVSSCVKAFVRNGDSVHELFGFDIMLDRHLKPWLLEVNISPSLHSNSQLDINIKGRLVRDLFNISGFTIPSRDASESSSSRYSLSTTERIKHSQFAQKNLSQGERKKILDHLTPHDVLVIMKSEDELSRRGHFERVYPTPCYERYRKFFETERYNNILLCEWAAKYQKCHKKGHLLLSRQLHVVDT